MSPGWITRYAANAVSGIRIVLTPIFLIGVERAPESGSAGWPAAVLFGLIAASDFADGYVARRFGVPSTLGRWLDHAADISFVVPALAVYAWLGVAPWWVPAAIAISFAAYVADSLWRSRGADGWPDLIGSRLGHAAGIMNYVLIGVLVGNETVGVRWIPAAAMQALFWLVPAYCGAAIVARFLGAPNLSRSRLNPEKPIKSTDAHR